MMTCFWFSTWVNLWFFQKFLIPLISVNTDQTSWSLSKMLAIENIECFHLGHNGHRTEHIHQAITQAGSTI